MDRTVTWASLEAGDLAEPADRARWLEERLVGLDLAPVIDELVMVGGAPAEQEDASAEAARSWLGADTSAVLEQGLGCLPVRKLDELFRRPGLLAGMQELVLIEGGPFWDGRVRASADTSRLAAEHCRGLVRKLGLGSGQEDVAARSAANTVFGRGRRQPIVALHGERLAGPRGMLKSMLWVAPFAAAAAALAIVASGLREPWRPAEPAPREADHALIVKAVVQDPEAVPDAVQPAGDVGWPGHPWEAMATSMPVRKSPATQVDGKAQAAVRLDEWARGSRAWVQRLDKAADMTPAQVRAAVARARGAVTAVESLADSGVAGLDSGKATRLRETCRQAVFDLDRLQEAMQVTAPHHGVTEAKQSIVRTLGEVERLLGGDAAIVVGPASQGVEADGQSPRQDSSPAGDGPRTPHEEQSRPLP